MPRKLLTSGENTNKWKFTVMDRLVDAYLRNHHKYTTIKISRQLARVNIDIMLKKFGTNETLEFLTKA